MDFQYPNLEKVKHLLFLPEIKPIEEYPKIVDDRYYYEKWLETGNIHMGTTYNLHENNYTKYELWEAGAILDKLQGTYPLT